MVTTCSCFSHQSDACTQLSTPTVRGFPGMPCFSPVPQTSPPHIQTRSTRGRTGSLLVVLAVDGLRMYRWHVRCSSGKDVWARYSFVWMKQPQARAPDISRTQELFGAKVLNISLKRSTSFPCGVCRWAGAATTLVYSAQLCSALKYLTTFQDQPLHRQHFLVSLLSI